jgi:hypothetical protein
VGSIIVVTRWCCWRKYRLRRDKAQERCEHETKAHQTPQGANRQEGSQTLKAEQRQGWKPAGPVDLQRWQVLKGTKVQERSRPAAAGRLGSLGQYSGGQGNSQEAEFGRFGVSGSAPGQEDHTAEETANSTVGSPTHVGGTVR